MKIFLIIAVIIVICFILSTICPSCKKPFSRENIATKEIDRWQATKKVVVEVKLRHQSGPFKGQEYVSEKRDNYIPVTYVKLVHYYRCKNCGHEWHRTHKKEMN